MIDNTIDKLIEKCNLGKMIDNPKRITGGLLNRMYKITTTNGIYAFKHLNQEVMKRENAINNHIFAEKISNIAKENGVNSLPALIINNEILQQMDGYYFLIYNWFDGVAIKDSEITIDKVRKVAIELAKLHKIDLKSYITKCKAYYDLHFVNWKFYLDKIEDEDIKELLKKNIERFEFLDKQSIENLDKISKNMVISHRDLDLPNILWNKKEDLMLIDWESTGLVNPCMEVIDTAWNWSGGQEYFDKEKFRTFLKTYESNGRDLTSFNEALKADFKAKFGWLEYNLKRITGIECIDTEEKKLGKKEVIRSVDEINKFDLYSEEMKL